MGAKELMLIIICLGVVNVSFCVLAVYNMRRLVIVTKRGRLGTIGRLGDNVKLGRIMCGIASVMVSILFILLSADMFRYYIYLYKGAM